MKSITAHTEQIIFMCVHKKGAKTMSKANHKAVRMFNAFLKINRLTASAETYDMFIDAIKNYDTFCAIEKESEKE